MRQLILCKNTDRPHGFKSDNIPKTEVDQVLPHLSNSTDTKKGLCRSSLENMEIGLIDNVTITSELVPVIRQFMTKKGLCQSSLENMEIGLIDNVTIT